MAADSAKSAKVSKQISQFRELLDYFEHGLINQDPTVVGIVVAIAVVLLTVCEYSLKFTIHLVGSQTQSRSGNLMLILSRSRAFCHSLCVCSVDQLDIGAQGSLTQCRGRICLGFCYFLNKC